MRLLKGIAIAMVALLVLAVALVGYFYSAAQVTIADIQAAGMQADGNPERFAQIKAQLEQQTFEGTRFSEEPLGEAADYAFITYTVRTSNQCLVPIDMIELQIVPEAGDALQLGDFAVHSLAAHSAGDLSATLLTAKDSHPLRDVIVTYYVWGVSFTLRERYGG